MSEDHEKISVVMTELEKRAKQAREVMKSAPLWVQRSAVFVGGENLRKTTKP